MKPEAIRRECEVIIDRTRMRAGLEPICGVKRKVGRPLKQSHPFPRRRKMSWEHIDPKSHREQHQAVYVEGCERCYTREYTYFKRNPNKRPASLDRTGPRLWIDEGWQEHQVKEQERKAEMEKRKTYMAQELVDTKARFDKMNAEKRTFIRRKGKS